MRVLQLTVMACCLASTTLAAPQLFPFTNLKKYFDHQTRHGPNPEVGPRDLQEESSRTQPTVLPSPVLSLPGVAPAFNYAPYLSAPSPVPTSSEEVFVDILKENPKLPRPTSLPLTYGDGASANPTSFLIDAFKTKPSSSIGGAYQPSSSISEAYKATPSSIGGAYKPTPYSSNSGAYKATPSSSIGGAYTPKTNALSNNKYPKKYQSELIAYGEGGAKKKNYSPKKEQTLYKEQQHQTSEQIAKTIDAANFQKEPKLAEATLAYRKPYQPQPQLSEQEASESGFHGISSGADGGFGGGFGDVGGGGGHLGGGGDRVEFQMHGHHGPHSYKFGYDTGKGHNRQFRFEERDAHGHVKGHYGFYDKSGKLQMVNYHADHHGFHADGNFGNHANR